MDFDLPEDLRMLKKTVADFVDRELIPIEHKTMDGPLMRADMREQLERKAKDLGLWLLEVPVEYGGPRLRGLRVVVGSGGPSRTIALPPRGALVFGPRI